MSFIGSKIRFKLGSIFGGFSRLFEEHENVCVCVCVCETAYKVDYATFEYRLGS